MLKFSTFLVFFNRVAAKKVGREKVNKLPAKSYPA